MPVFAHSLAMLKFFPDCFLCSSVKRQGDPLRTSSTSFFEGNYFVCCIWSFQPYVAVYIFENIGLSFTKQLTVGEWFKVCTGESYSILTMQCLFGENTCSCIILKENTTWYLKAYLSYLHRDSVSDHQTDAEKPLNSDLESKVNWISDLGLILRLRDCINTVRDLAEYLVWEVHCSLVLSTYWRHALDPLCRPLTQRWGLDASMPPLTHCAFLGSRRRGAGQ